MLQKTIIILSLLALMGAMFMGYQFVNTLNQVDHYRRQLDTLAADYQDLRETYNEAVRRTAVTELLVQNGELYVIIRTAEGEIRRLATPFDPNHEIYVDYIVLDGRLWIRRVFDDRTAPEQGVVIHPQLAAINWDAAHVDHGKAVYRKLAEGRWIITVTGDGSLGLARAEQTRQKDLSPPPTIRQYEER